ncbi:hypothetical protein D3C84_991520 [compost metagenome]
MVQAKQPMMMLRVLALSRLAVMPPSQAPISIPAPSLRIITQSTAPASWCARRELMPVKIMVGREVPRARWVMISGATPCAWKLRTSTGTMMSPPPMPNSPASMPAKAPNTRYPTNSIKIPSPSEWRSS